MSSPNGVSISAQIERARHEGDASSLLQAYRNYLRFIARDGVGVALRSKVDVSDVAQDVLIRAGERFEQFRGGTEKELRGWLRRILANHIVDLTRKYHVGGGRNLVQEQSIEQVLYESSKAFGQVLALSGTSPSQHAVLNERDALIADALAELSADHEEVIKLRTMQGLRWEEVARRMGRSDGAVRKLWFRALQMLRPALEKRL